MDYKGVQLYVLFILHCILYLSPFYVLSEMNALQWKIGYDRPW